MASFKSVLQVKGRQYTVLYSDFDIHQFTDSLGRPASPTFGGVYTLDVESPPSGDSTLFEWMVEPTLFLNGQVLIKNLTGTTLKVIKFYNAYCVDLEQHFDGIGRSGDQSSLRLSLRISPQAVKIGEQFHDNNWPAPEPIVDWHWADMDAQSNPKAQTLKEPSALSEGLHTVLDVVGMIPVVGEVADAANAAIYAAEGDYANAALSAAAMIPIAGNVATVAKLGRKALKLADKAVALRKAKDKVSRSKKALDAAAKRKAKKAGDELEIYIDDQNKIDRSFLNAPKEHGQAPTFKKDGTKVEIHHQGQNREGPFKEMHWEDHRGKGNDKINHPNKGEPSQVDRGEFNRAKKKYWKKEFPKK